MYLDPPFNSDRTYEAPIGSEAAGAMFKDAWTLNDVDVQEHGLLADTQPALYHMIAAARICHSKGMMSYLIMMASRALELKRILKPTGSLYVHCDPKASHYLKLLLDAVFGKDGFRNEIVWCYTGPGNVTRDFGRKHDVILRYTAGPSWIFNADAIRVPYSSATMTRRHYSEGIEGSGIVGGYSEGRSTEQVDATYGKGKVPEDWWVGIGSGGQMPRGERTGYPTQKPMKLLERIIMASCPATGIVLDPFCGCATTCIAAQKLGRRWIGIDLSVKAADLVKVRARKELGLFSLDLVHRTDIPTRTDQGPVPPYKSQKHTLFGKQEGLCTGCKISFPFRNFTVDHVIPQSKGGTDHLENLQLLCGACNSLKGDRSQAYLLKQLHQP